MLVEVMRYDLSRRNSACLRIVGRDTALDKILDDFGNSAVRRKIDVCSVFPALPEQLLESRLEVFSEHIGVDHQRVLRTYIGVKPEHVYPDFEPRIDKLVFIIEYHVDQRGKMRIVGRKIDHQILEPTKEIHAVEQSFSAPPH